jgi:hypothetical protein
MPVDYNLELRLAYLRAAVASVMEDEDKLRTYRAFYEGEQGVVLTDRQKEYLKESGDSFANLCKRVVSIPKDRLALTAEGIAAATGSVSKFADAATGWWKAAGLDAGQKAIYECSLRDHTCALVIGWDEAQRRPTFTSNLLYDGQTGLVRFHYDSDGTLLFASKRWTVWNPLKSSETGKRRLTVYRPDMIERYEADGKIASGWRSLTPPELGGLPNPQPWVDVTGAPLGIPVIPFDNPGGSELADVIRLQEEINHALATFDIATDFHGWPLLWLKDVKLDRDEAGNQIIPNFGPGDAIILEKEGEAGRIEPADLAKLFQAGVLSWVQVLALIKGWPLFLFDRSQQPPSGVALRIMEGSLVAQVQDKHAVFGTAWLKAFELGRKLHQLYTGEELPGEIRLTWQPAETQDKAAETEAQAKKWESAEIPIIQRWREAGYTQKQIDQMLEDKAREDSFGIADTLPAGVTEP